MAKEQLAEKIRLENKLKPKLKKFFKQVNKDVQIIWKATGHLPEFTFYETDLTAILRSHYRLVADVFNSTARDMLNAKSATEKLEVKQDLAEELESSLEEEESRIDEVILATLLAYIATHSLDQARLILTTTNKEYEKIVAKVISEAAAEGRALSRSEAAELIGDEFNDKIDGRVDTISLTETQNMAEKTKIVEITVLSASALVIGGVLMNAVFAKEWNAILDDVVRAHHAAANGQIVRHDQPFIVKGESLMFPGDTTLGASPDNIINCRCTLTFTIQ